MTNLVIQITSSCIVEFLLPMTWTLDIREEKKIKFHMHDDACAPPLIL